MLSTWKQFQLESRWGKGLQATNALNMEQFQLPTLAVSPVILSEDRKVLWDALSSQRLRIAIHGEFLKMRGPKVIQIFFPRFEKHSAHAFLILATLQKLSKHIKKYWFVTNYPHIPPFITCEWLTLTKYIPDFFPCIPISFCWLVYHPHFTRNPDYKKHPMQPSSPEVGSSNIRMLGRAASSKPFRWRFFLPGSCGVTGVTTRKNPGKARSIYRICDSI